MPRDGLAELGRCCQGGSGPVATWASSGVGDSLSCGLLLFLLPLEFVFVSPTLPTALCCDTELAVEQLQRCWTPRERAALKAQLSLER